MNIEIERKFLVKDQSFKQMATSHSHIQQGYMDVRGATVRVRLRDDKAFLTIKGKSNDGGVSRYEFEREIPMDDAEELLLLCMAGRVDKTRWLVPYGGRTFEVDEFHGENDGLIIAELELEARDAEYERPPFLDTEVTGDRHFYNKYLIANPFPVWSGEVMPQYRNQ